MIFKSKIKAKLRNDEPALITCLHLTDPSLHELIGHMGWDGIWMDLEHHGYSVETAQHLMRGARVGGADIMARPGKGEYMRMGRLLESGAQAILYPRCESADEARDVVRWGKFHPIGQRGVDAANPDNPYLLVDLKTYLQRAYEETSLFLQIEEWEVAERAEEILSVDGVDALFVGPGDMSVLAGTPGDFDNPKIQKAIRQVAKAAERTGKHWGMPAHNTDRIKQILDLGARIICHGSDITAMKTWFEDTRAKMENLGFKLTPGQLRF